MHGGRGSAVPGSMLETATAASDCSKQRPVYGLTAELAAICGGGPVAAGVKDQGAEEALNEDHVKITFEGDSNDELRGLILALDRKLNCRFDSLELSLAKMGSQLLTRESTVNNTVSSTSCLSVAITSNGAALGAPFPPEKFHSVVDPLVLSAKAPSARAVSVEESMGPVTSVTSVTSTDAAKGLALAATRKSEDSDADGPKFRLRKEWNAHLKEWWIRDAINKENFSKTLEDLLQDDENGSIDLSTLKPWYVLWPSSSFRLGWDLTTMGLVAHDMAVIPVHMGFNTDDNMITKALFWPFLLFWSMDIPLTFFTGYYRRGHVETKLWMIARNYLSTWFLLDISMVSSSWAEALLGMSASSLKLGRVGKTLRILRIVRSMRLLRLVKLRRILEDIQDRITSEYFHIIIAVLRLSVIIVWTNHFIACTWWGIGASGPDEGSPDAGWSWTSHFKFQSVNLPYQYFTSLHWSLTQFTPASMEVSPRNLGERIFAVCVLVFAMIVFSSFVSSITAAMTQLRNLGKSVDKSFVVLRRYLRGHNVPHELNQRIMRCVQNGLKAKKEEIPECDVDLLKYLSPSLHMELMYHVYAPAVLRHPFFETYAEEDPIAMQRVCQRALKRLCCAAGDILFTQACTGDHMFFVLRGKFRYVPAATDEGAESGSECIAPLRSQRTSGTIGGNGMTGSPSLRKSTGFRLETDYSVCKDEWFCEASLWCLWAHTGTMRASAYCEVLVVDPVELAKVTALRRLVLDGTRRYGETFVSRLNEEAADGPVSDVRPIDADVLDDMATAAFTKFRSRSKKEENATPAGGAREWWRP